MPARDDIKLILVIGSGPIMIGQACEFDYSGCQAVQVLRAEGYRVILLNPNPATMMTTPGLADTLYLDPVEPDYVEAIIAKERPDALLATMGGQTALNCAMELHARGVLEKYNVELIGASIDSIRVAEDRGEFRELMDSIGLQSPRSVFVNTIEDGKRFADENGYPLIIRPSFTLGGSGGATVTEESALLAALEEAFLESPTSSALLEESLIGWGEFEFEVMRDRYDNAVIVCAIENVDAMGIHTGDSITVAPTQSLSDAEYQRMRDASIAVLRAVGVDCGGSNVQFAYNHERGDLRIIEMNPRVSRSSALASKATGYPIARCAAKLAVGYSLAEISNEITQQGSACFEPSIDYVAVKVPRFAVDKFSYATQKLGTSMKAIGESLSLGRTFIAGLNKAIRAVETGAAGLEPLDKADEALFSMLENNHPDRMLAFFTLLFRIDDSAAEAAADRAEQVQKIYSAAKYNVWFAEEIRQFVEFVHVLRRNWQSDPTLFILAYRYGMSAAQCAVLTGQPIGAIEKQTKALFAAMPMAYHMVDTCAGEFNAQSPYYYSAPGEINEAAALSGRRVIIIGSGPNRIGQGLEFDTCCTLASVAYRERGVQTILINSNPETVSTDHNFSDRLYLEPVERESVAHIMRNEDCADLVVQLGGQTGINMAEYLCDNGASIIGTSLEAIHDAEDRAAFAAIIAELGLHIPRNASATSRAQAVEIADSIGYPILLRPSFVLGGAKMAILSSHRELEAHMQEIRVDAQNPVQIDEFLEDAFEYDVDVVADGHSVYVAGIMEHIESAGIHSGDSACVFPPYKYTAKSLDIMRAAAVKLARRLKIVGFMNIQFAAKDGVVYILEVNPRVSRTVPFISKVTGVNLVAVAVDIWLGKSLKELGLVDSTGYGEGKPIVPWAVKEAKFSFARFPNFDPLLGPEMRSTGESIGIGSSFGAAYAKAITAAGVKLPTSGAVVISVNDRDKASILPVARALRDLNFKLYTTAGTGKYLQAHDVPSTVVRKGHESGPNVLDIVRDEKIHLVINTPLGSQAQTDDSHLRLAAIRHHIPYTTTTSAAEAAVEGINYLRNDAPEIYPVPDAVNFSLSI